jgi:hypothetical protein
MMSDELIAADVGVLANIQRQGEISAGWLYFSDPSLKRKSPKGRVNNKLSISGLAIFRQTTQFLCE